MMSIGILIILASIVWAVLVLMAAGMSDAQNSFGWSDLWLSYIGLAVGAYLIAAKFLPWLRLP